MGSPRIPFDEEEGWVLCRGRLRVIRDGFVACDTAGPVAVERCRLCRHLETLAGERDPALSCTTPDPVRTTAIPLPR